MASRSKRVVGRPRGKRDSKTSPRRAKTVSDAMKALALRSEGLTIAEIGKRLGVVPSRAHDLVSEAMGSVYSEAVESSRQLDLVRLDALLAVHYGKALKGDHAAFDAVMAVMARRAKLIGYDAPTAVKTDTTVAGTFTVTNADNVRDALDGKLARLAAATAAQSGTGEPHA